MSNSKLQARIAVALVLTALIALFVWIIWPHASPPSDLELPSEAQIASSDGQASPGLELNVYIDGSGSIEHFLHQPPQQKPDTSAPAPASGANYLKGLFEQLQPIMQTEPAWHGHSLHFWRFGGDCPTAIRDGGVTDMAETPQGNFPEKNTKIDVVYRPDPTSGCPGHAKVSPEDTAADHAHPELRIVISDLYVSNLHMTDLGAVIARKYFAHETGGKEGDKSNNAVSILAIRNPFFGRAEDLPGKAEGRPIATSMPFYVIVAGPASDVQLATQSLIDHAGLLDAFVAGNAKLIYFSQNYGRLSPEMPKVDGQLRSFHLYQKHYRDSNISFYTLKKGKLKARWDEPPENSWASTSSKFPWQKDWSILPGKSDYSLQTNAFIYGTRKGKENPAQPDRHAASAVSSCAGDNQTCIAIDRSGLRRWSSYRFEVSLQSSRSENFRAQADAMQNWSIEMGDAEKISRDPSGRFPRLHGVADASPGRTPDLAEFLTDLQGETYPDALVRTANHHFIYVQAN